MNEKIKPPEHLLKKANVVGFSNTLKKRKREDGTEEEVVYVYVTKKVAESQLAPEDVVDKEIEGIKTDVIELGGEPTIFSCRGGRGTPRELVPGTSIGNYHITAGTLGWYFKKGKTEYIQSNAHVFCDYPHRNEAIEKRIVSPGKLDGGTLSDVVAYYSFHVPIKPQKPILNYPLSWWDRLKKRFGLLKEPPVPDDWVVPKNYTDFAVAKMTDDVIPIYETKDFPVSYNYNFSGSVFAGTSMVTLICKAKYMLELGYTPQYVDVAPIEYHDRVRKSGRTTGDTIGRVIDESCHMYVSYGLYTALFNDIAMALRMSQGGDSGSSVWKKKV